MLASRIDAPPAGGRTAAADSPRPTGQQGIKNVLRLVRELFGRTPATKFGPLALKAIREKMVDKGWCRKTINDNIQCAGQILFPPFGAIDRCQEPQMRNVLRTDTRT
jgi:hypothetical protein